MSTSPEPMEVRLPPAVVTEWRRRIAAAAEAERAAASYTLGVVDALGIDREAVIGTDLDRGVLLVGEP